MKETVYVTCESGNDKAERAAINYWPESDTFTIWIERMSNNVRRNNWKIVSHSTIRINRAEFERMEKMINN